MENIVLSSDFLHTFDDGYLKIKYGFSMNRASSYQNARDILFSKGLMDIRIAPGMTVPVNLSSKIAVRSKSKNLSVIPEFPESTLITQEEKNIQYEIYSVSFKRFGENILIIELFLFKITCEPFFIIFSFIVKKHILIEIRKCLL